MIVNTMNQDILNNLVYVYKIGVVNAHGNIKLDRVNTNMITLYQLADAISIHNMTAGQLLLCNYFITEDNQVCLNISSTVDKLSYFNREKYMYPGILCIKKIYDNTSEQNKRRSEWFFLEIGEMTISINLGYYTSEVIGYKIFNNSGADLKLSNTLVVKNRQPAFIDVRDIDSLETLKNLSSKERINFSVQNAKSVHGKMFIVPKKDK